MVTLTCFLVMCFQMPMVIICLMRHSIQCTVSKEHEVSRNDIRLIELWLSGLICCSTFLEAVSLFMNCLFICLSSDENVIIGCNQ